EDNIAEVKQVFNEKYGHEPNVSVVSPIDGQELVKIAIYALAIALIGMIICVTFRIERLFAVTAIIALLHDAIILLAVFSSTRIEVDATIVTALLTIIGYSINNTIVVCDRIRENIRKTKKRMRSVKELAKIVNTSILQTFWR